MVVDRISESANNAEQNDDSLSSSSSSLRREPSFSRWCDLNLERENLEREGADQDDFQLPFLLQNQQRLGMDTSGNLEGNGDETYVPFDIETRVKGDLNQSSCRVSAPMADAKSELSPANVLKTLFFIIVWYTFSLFLTLYNKSLLGDNMGKFPAPLLMNTFHFSMQAVLSKAITWIWWERFHKGVHMTWRDYFSKVVPTALATALDINLSNASLVFISVTFATMCKSASPIFLLVFAFAFRLESPSLKLFGIILVISLGILLTVAKETEFEFWGFLFVMLAAVMSGFRWCMTQILLQREAYGLKNPLTFMSYVTPIMAVSTGLMSLVLDPWDEFPGNEYFNSSWHITRSCLLMLFGGTLAFFMVLTEYVLISVTSAVTVTIAGIVKEAVTILVAVFYFHDDFTWMKGIGLLTIIVGVSLFNLFNRKEILSMLKLLLVFFLDTKNFKRVGKAQLHLMSLQSMSFLKRRTNKMIRFDVFLHCKYTIEGILAPTVSRLVKIAIRHLLEEYCMYYTLIPSSSFLSCWISGNNDFDSRGDPFLIIYGNFSQLQVATAVSFAYKLLFRQEPGYIIFLPIVFQYTMTLYV